MTPSFTAAMRRALDSTRAQDLAAATEAIQDALAGRDARRTGESPASAPPTPADRFMRCIDHADVEKPASAAPHHGRSTPRTATGRMRKPLGEVLAILREGKLKAGLHAYAPGQGRETVPPPALPEGASFTARTLTCKAGTRDYRLYVPATGQNRPRGLIVMLHGCKQNPVDFAVGTNMNAVAEANGLLVAYPAQVASANPSACWNWFAPAHQQRDAGEPAIIAGITREIAAEFGLTGNQIFVAGLSAGGAMAAVMAETYPDLYAAAGIHSGLAYGSANDALSAFAAMRGDIPRAGSTGRAGNGKTRMIVFHGEADRTVHPRNADHIVPGLATSEATETMRATANGKTYHRKVMTNPDGAPAAEIWMVDSGGHAWSGGNPRGSYTDAGGPDASTEMVRFFLQELKKRSPGQREHCC